MGMLMPYVAPVLTLRSTRAEVHHCSSQLSWPYEETFLKSVLVKSEGNTKPLYPMCFYTVSQINQASCFITFTTVPISTMIAPAGIASF
jgi:hypothetical protein